MIQLYYAAPSIYGRKVLAVLDEKGLDYEIKKMSFASQDHLKPEYLALNPNGEIPTLLDGDFAVYESTAIIEYLNDEYPEPPLLPEDSEGRARVRMAEDYCDLHLYPEVIRCFIKKVLKNEELTAEDTDAVTERLQRLETLLAGKTWLAGDFSLADCAAMPAFASLEALGVLDACVKSSSLKAYVSKLKQRPGYKGASLMSLEAAAAS